MLHRAMFGDVVDHGKQGGDMVGNDGDSAG